MDKKEGGESQSDVGGKTGHRLSPVYYTSIAEIKAFCFKLEKTISSKKK
jgi:selenocysteine lyase/cysteine desulfurase